MEVPPGSRYQVTGSTGSGNRSVAAGLADSRATRQISATSGSGEVTVSYLGSWRAELR